MLRVLQEGELERVGEERTRRVNIGDTGCLYLNVDDDGKLYLHIDISGVVRSSMDGKPLEGVRVLLQHVR